jgi:PAS domain S-box-containing protein
MKTADRNSTRASLEQTVAEHRAVLAAALDPIVTIDSMGTIQSASNSIERVFGWKPQEIIGANVKLLMPEPHHSAHDRYLDNYRRTHQTNIMNRTREFNAVRKDGTQFPIELSVSRVDIPGSAEPWFMGILHDIGERKQIEQELARSRIHLEEMVKERTAQLQASHEQLRQADRLASIGTLAAGLGHDMNNVLLPIRARLDALDSLQLPEQAREQFQAVRRSIAYLQQLSDGLHLLALDPDDADASTGITHIAEWWSQVGPLLAKALPKRVKFNVDLASDLPEVAIAPHRLTQAILNLVVNAGEAIRAENGMVTVQAKRIRQRGIVQLSVIDDGEGMSPEVLKHAMDPFFTTKKRGLGTGLGLSLVRGVLQGVGGEIQITSEPGKGTCVCLSLPVATVQHSATQPNQALSAVITIRDRRAATFVGALLQTARFQVRFQDDGEPQDCALWVLEPDPSKIGSAEHFLRRDELRRVILFGAADVCWEPLRTAVIKDTRDFEHIRQVVGETVQAITDQP